MDLLCLPVFRVGRSEQERTTFQFQYSPSTSSSTAETCSSGPAIRWTTCSSSWSTVPELGGTHPSCGPLFGTRARPRPTQKQPSPSVGVAVEITAYRTLFRVQFGKLTLKAYTKGERVLHFEAVVHNTAALNCGRRLVRFPLIATRLKGMIERFLTMLDCVDAAFV